VRRVLSTCHALLTAEGIDVDTSSLDLILPAGLDAAHRLTMVDGCVISPPTTTDGRAACKSSNGRRSHHAI